MKRYLLLLLGLRWVAPAPPAQPIFRVHSSTRHVTCLADNFIGTSGGVRRPGTAGVELPGVVIHGVSGEAVATDAGLFDGSRCLDPAPAWSVARTPEGLVSGHNRGRVKFWTTGRVVDCPSDAPIHSLAWDGACLLAASNQGLWVIDGETVRAEQLSSNPISSTVTCLVVHPTGVLVGTAAGPYRRSGGDWSALSGGVVNVSALAVTDDGRAWVGTADRGLYEERNGTLNAVVNTPKQVTALLWTVRGLVVGTDHGAYLGGRPLYDWHHEISGNHVTALACSSKSVWAGTFQDGLSRFQGESWSPVEGLPSQWINQLSASGDKVLVRFSSGLVLRGESQGANTRWQTMGKSCGWPKDWTSALGPGWVATLSGFYTESGRGWKTFTPKPELQGVTVTGVTRFRGRYWLASQNGVYHYDPQTGQCRQYLAELPDSWVTCLESFHDQLWSGTFRGGLACFDGRKWRTVTSPSPRIHCLLATPTGLWIGTPTGLGWTDGQNWRVFGTAEGLPSPRVWSLASRGDELWVGTDSGLCQASQKAMTQL